jgi:hypothetical protein
MMGRQWEKYEFELAGNDAYGLRKYPYKTLLKLLKLLSTQHSGSILNSNIIIMKYLLISILYCYPTCLLAQAVEDTILTNYFNKVGIEELSKVSSYVYFYRSLSNYDESMFFTGKDSKANIMFYKRKKAITN